MKSNNKSTPILEYLFEVIEYDIHNDLNDYRKTLGLIDRIYVDSNTNEADIFLVNEKKIACKKEKDYITMCSVLKGTSISQKIRSRKDCINFINLFK